MARSAPRIQTITLELHVPAGALQAALRAVHAELDALAGRLVQALQTGRAEPLLPADLPAAWRTAAQHLVDDRLAEARRAAGRLGEIGRAVQAASDEAADHLRRGAAQAAVALDPNTWRIQVLADGLHLALPAWLPGRGGEGADEGTWRLPLRLDEAQRQRLEALLASARPLSGRLFARDGSWFFSASFLRDVPLPSQGTVVGVAQGGDLLALAAEPSSNRRLALSDRHVAHRMRRFRRLERRLLAAGDKRAARRVRAKALRYQEAVDRRTANSLVGFAAGFPRPMIALDDAPVPAGASYTSPEASAARVRRLVARKAERAGIPVVAVPAEPTSCARCGRPSGPTEGPASLLDQDRATRFRCPSCGHSAHGDLNAARLLATRSRRRPRPAPAPGGQSPAGQAEGTAAPASPDPRKGRTRPGGSPPRRGWHAPRNLHRSLDPNRFIKEVHPMASLIKDLSDSSSQFVTATLDNVKSYGDRVNEEVKNANLLDASRRVFDSAIDSTKTVVKTASEQNGLDPFAKARAVADGTLEAAREVVNAVAEESKKADLFGLSTRLTLEGLSTLRNQIDLGIDTTKAISNRLMPMATSGKSTVTRAPQVTRVEIEHEKKEKGSKAQA